MDLPQVMKSLIGLNLVGGKVFQSIFFLFISQTCNSLSSSLIIHNLAAMSLQGLIASIPWKFQRVRSFRKF